MISSMDKAVHIPTHDTPEAIKLTSSKLGIRSLDARLELVALDLEERKRGQRDSRGG
jgi:hypothetical protein